MAYVNRIFDPAYYNEIDEYAANWIENLIRLGAIAPGVVDRRSIVDVRSDDLRGFRQCHFFAGIGVWSYSLRRAGVSDDTALWTGSCPCQPFSAAGKGTGVDDERHLWPAWFHLIGESEPDLVFGEQVASKDGLGWLDLVFSDMEAAGYAIGPVDTCSAGSGAPHIRQRLRFSAYNLRSATGRMEHNIRYRSQGRVSWWPDQGWRGLDGSTGRDSAVGVLADTKRIEREECLSGSREGTSEKRRRETIELAGLCVPDRLADDNCVRLSETSIRRVRYQEYHSQPRSSIQQGLPGPTNGFWRDADWLFCRDGKWRPIGASSQQMVDGSPADMGLGSTFPLVKGEAFKEDSGHPVYAGKSRQGMLKGYGNAIDAEATVDFLVAAFESIDDLATVRVDDLLV